LKPRPSDGSIKASTRGEKSGLGVAARKRLIVNQRHGKAKPFRTAGGRTAGYHPPFLPPNEKWRRRVRYPR
ncbi:MAG: hypothetical protein ACLQVM_06255, partial [Terriglobia bacterium]